jgi:hypothetical protein
VTLPLQTPVEFLNVSAAVSGMSTAEQLAYQTGLAAPTTVLNLDGAGLHIAWDIMRTRSSKTDSGEVTIRNLSTSFRLGLYATWQQFNATSGGFKVGVHIGWGGTVNLAMSGDVWEMLPEVRSGEDVLTVMRFGEGQRQVKDSTTPTPKQYTYEAGNALGLWLTIQDMFFQLGGLRVDPSMQAVFTTAVTSTPLAASGSWDLSGELVDNINDLLDTFGLEWKVYNGQVIFMSRGITSSSQAPVAVLLTPATGLLDWTPLDDAGIACTALAQPSVRPGTQFIVQDGFGVPVGAPGFRVETVRFAGQTDTESLMFLTGRRSIPI